jgi:CRP-like cAMP-binding protein
MLTAEKYNLSAMKSMMNRGFLGTMEIFKSVPPEALAELERKMVERRYARHESILLEGDPAESVWFVKEGRVKATVSAPNGRCQTLCMAGPRGMFGTCCCLGGAKVPCQSVAETDAVVMSLPMGEFRALMARTPAVASAFLGQVSNRLRQSKDNQTFEHESVEKRILHLVVNLVAEFGNTLPLTRREIAEMAGTTVETSIRTFLRLEAEGLVATGRGQITVKNVQSLLERIEEI